MNTRGRGGKTSNSGTSGRHGFRITPIARTVALTLAASGVVNAVHAQQAFSPAWFAAKGAVQSNALATGTLPNGQSSNALTAPGAQSQAARQKLQQSLTNLSAAAQAIALQQALQQKARGAAMAQPSAIPDGLGAGGLQIDSNDATKGWINAAAPTQTHSNGQTTVTIGQTADKAILNWETFNVGRNTTVDFQQQSGWAVLNRVNDPGARPSQIEGQIKADGTVFILNRNGVLFSGSSQVNLRNLVVAAAEMTDTQFTTYGLYGASVTAASFRNAGGPVSVLAGAEITTREPQSVTDGGGYVLLLGTGVDNAGQITTRKGQAELAAGDSFIIRKGVATDANQFSTTRGSEIQPQFPADIAGEDGAPVPNPSGNVINTGLITAREGDITLAGRDVRQDGTAISTTTVNQRGTIHLLTPADDSRATVSLGAGATTAILVEDDGQTALDSQRDALVASSATLDQARINAAAVAGSTKSFDNYSTLSDRRDLSRIEIVGGGNVDFEGGSLTLATGGQLAVSSGNRAAGSREATGVPATHGAVHVDGGAMLDVSGSVGVQVAMEGNNIQVNVQGNELRDAPLNRDSGRLFNSDIWVDRRDLILVPAGTDGYASDRYYTAGGLLEVSGYLGNQGHSVGEWMAQGGTINLATDNVVAASGSRFNMAGGTLDVASGYIRQTWLSGSDGRVYSAGDAPADVAYNALYTGYVEDHARWRVTDSSFNPIIAPQQRIENGYTVGRDAGSLLLNSANVSFQGDIDAQVFNGVRQVDVRPAAVSDGYKLSQTQAALAARLVVQTFDPTLNPSFSSTRLNQVADVRIDNAAPAEEVPGNDVWLDLDGINSARLGGLSTVGIGDLSTGGDITLAPGGALSFQAATITLGGGLTARSGSVRLTSGVSLSGAVANMTIGDGVTIDTRGLWTNAALDPASAWGIAFRNGGTVGLSTYGELALEAGSRIDASAGGVLLANGMALGGNGGDISLSAGGLVIDGGGELAAYGFGRGGKLSVTTPAAISIGGSLTHIRGVLSPGETAIFDVTLAEDSTLPAGSVLPFDVSIKMNVMPPGIPVPSQTVWNVAGGLIIGPDGWQVPPGAAGYTYINGQFNTYGSGSFVPPGTDLYTVSIPEGYALPSGAFPNGIPIVEKLVPVPAGLLLTSDLVLTAGSVIPRGAVASQPFRILSTFDIIDANAFFQQGFSAYSLSGAAGLIVQPDTQLNAAMPVYRFTGGSLVSGASQRTLAGDALAEAVELALPPLFAENPAKGTLKQRAGADLSLAGAVPGSVLPGTRESPLVSGALIIGEGAVVTVDPGHVISLTSKGQVDVEGSLVAPGGGISVVNTRTIPDVELAHRIANPNDYGFASDDPTDALSVWIGGHAVLDVAGRAYTATDAQGSPYGVVLDGGSIVLGGAGGNDPTSIGGVLSTESYVVVRPGALIDASGASASLSLGDGDGGRVLRQVASDGGAITVSSFQGFFLDGDVRAGAGGVGAAGGSLSLVLESATYANVTDSSTRSGRVLHVTQGYAPSALAAGLAPGEADPTYVPAEARISVDQVVQGGFDSLSLWGRTAIAFDGDVNLHLGRSLTLAQGFLYQTTAGANVTLSAPYVLFDGGTLLRGNSNGQYWPAPTRLPDFATGGIFTVESGLMDLRNAVRINYDQTVLQSSGDLRFLASTGPAPDAGLNGGGVGTTDLRTLGDLELEAAQIYPASGVVATVYAGGLAGTTDGEPSRLTIRSAPGQSIGDAPAQPYSVFGSLALSAGTIEQGGVLRAPYGALTLNASEKVELLSGSITSVGTQDLVIPFGGTVDGVTYTLNGATVPAPDLIAGSFNGTFSPGGAAVYGSLALSINSPSLVSDPGSLLDVSGGGQFVGGAFITGRGGSVDTLLSPLNPGGKVYALVPGATTAPVPGGYYGAWNGAVPGTGQQITIPDGVPGLPGGTYTLMPANYALLPGAWRVELGGSTPDVAGAIRNPNGSWAVTGVQSIANTGFHDSLNTLVTLTDGATLRTYSNYNEQSYDQFQLGQAQTFGSLRPMLDSDGSRLYFAASILADAPAGGALTFDGRADFSAGRGGLPGSFALMLGTGYVDVAASSLIITAPGSTASNDASTVTVAAAEINKLEAPNLYLGGRPAKGYNAPNIGMTGVAGRFGSAMADNLVVEGGATLTGGQVVLGATVKITMEEGSSINTLGRGQTWLDSASGLLLGDLPSIYGSYAMLVVSNGQFTLDAPSGLFGSNIELQDAVTLYSEGTVGFYADLGVALTGTPKIGTRNLSLSVPSFNIGSDAALAAAGTLPAGMNLNQRVLDTLFAGDPEQGVPSVENLVLTATRSINFFGTVDLDTIDPATGRSRLAQFTLNSPAIYGYGTAGDTVHLIADTLVWNDTLREIAYSDYAETRYGASPPGALLAQGPGSGTLQIDAATIVIGNPTPSKPDTTIPYNRLMLGFSEVDFNATGRITGNAKGTVSIYQSGADPSQAFDPATYAGTGGNLHLNTPLLTGSPASVIAYHVGGTLDVKAPAGSTAAAVAGDVGAELDLHAGSINVASSVILPSGKLVLTADGDVTLADSHIDLSGRRLSFFDVTRDTWGGDVQIVSAHGSIVQQAGSSLDVSAAHEDAGTLRLVALDPGQGAVLLGGTLLGGGADGYGDGGIDVRAQRIGDSIASLDTDFAALNTLLSGAGFTGSRAFDLRQGSLTIGDEVRARTVQVSMDAGSLTVAGRIDATGAQPGSIRLAARDDVRLEGSATLDAHGTVLQVDSYGLPIEARNRGSIELTSAQGWLQLDDGTSLDVSAPGESHGRVTLNARRASETGGDILIDAAGHVNVRGATSVAVNGFWTYSPTDADGTIVQDNGGTTPVAADGTLGFNQIDAQNQIFYANALADSALQTRLAGLKAQGDAYHLRPGVEIDSADASNGRLTFRGDLNLAGYRYGPDADRNPTSPTYGAGEPLALTVRATGDLDIKGSITDGFGLPKASPDDSPILFMVGQRLTADYTLQESVTLAAGSTLGVGAVLPFDVQLSGGDALRAGTAAPYDITLAAGTGPDWAKLYGYYDVFGFGGGLDSGGSLLYPVEVVAGQVDDYYWNGYSFGPGSIIYSGLGDGAVIHAGTIFRVLDQAGADPSYADVVFRSGPQVAASKALPQQVTLAADYTLAAALTASGTIITPTQTYNPGAVIPAGTVLPSGTTVGEGASLPFAFDINPTTWRAGNPLVLVGGYTLTSALDVTAGTVLPTGSSFSQAVYSADKRPVWAVAPMLAPGTQSASISLVGGADLSAADTRTLLPRDVLGGRGNITLNDPRIDNTAMAPIFSVVRTGTGDLDVLAGGDLSQASPFGVYTAGTELELSASNAAFTLPRAPLAGIGTPTITGIAGYDAALNERATWYPDHGGDLFIGVQGDLAGNVWTNGSGSNNSDVVAWLWHQGADEMGHPPAWSINFGTFVSAGSRYNQSTQQSDPLVRVVGFNGFGALGGGNATVLVDGNAGLLTPFSQFAFGSSDPQTSSGVMVAVGATGRVTQVGTTPDGAVTGGTLVETGGGDLIMKIGGGFNAVQATLGSSGLMQGTLTNLRGSIDVTAGAIGGLNLTYGTKGGQDPRGADIYTAQGVSQYQSGPIVVPGDGVESFRTRGDLVMSVYQDAPMLLPNVTQSLRFIYTFGGALLDHPTRTGLDYNWFSLWTPGTTVSLFSAGGNVLPFNGGTMQYLPPQLEVVAGSGNIYYGSEYSNQPATLELLPSATGGLELLAMGSIYAAARGSGLNLGMSGARAGVNDMPNPFKPAWELLQPGYGGNLLNVTLDPSCNLCGTNTLVSIAPPAYDGAPSTYSSTTGYFAFQGLDTPTTDLHAGDTDPIRFYAVNGDIVGAVLGAAAIGYSNRPSTYMVAKAMQIHAGRDIVGFGLLGSPFVGGTGGSYIMNANDTDVSMLEAGRDIFYANVNVAGPGTLEVTAAGDLYQGNQGNLVSIGSVIPGDTRPGASIATQVGFGRAGADWAVLAALYLDPANQADITSGLPLADQPGKVAHTYQMELQDWLKGRYGHQAVGAEDALAYFDALPAEQQRIFLRTVYYAELKAGGREYNDPSSKRFGSYLRGRQMIATLFPDEGDAQRGGDLVQFGPSGIQTQFGGDIQLLVPAGQIIVGVEGVVPPATSGLITQGAGDIDIYSQGSILLGLSRIMTTFGGGILGWSAEGDINAGRGSKTTLVYTPPKRVYDQWGDVKLSPQVPSTGAGIATLNPIPEVPPGDVDLIAPLGTIDAGEAGIRVSGDVNLAALRIVNAANIQVQGEAHGLPVEARVNVGALTSASAAANAAVGAMQDIVKREKQKTRSSVIQVEVLGFGDGESGNEGAGATVPLGVPQTGTPYPYDPGKLTQIVGLGNNIDPKDWARLTEEERRRLRQDR